MGLGGRDSPSSLSLTEMLLAWLPLVSAFWVLISGRFSVNEYKVLDLFSVPSGVEALWLRFPLFLDLGSVVTGRSPAKEDQVLVWLSVSSGEDELWIRFPLVFPFGVLNIDRFLVTEYKVLDLFSVPSGVVDLGVCFPSASSAPAALLSLAQFGKLEEVSSGRKRKLSRYKENILTLSNNPNQVKFSIYILINQFELSNHLNKKSFYIYK